MISLLKILCFKYACNLPFFKKEMLKFGVRD